VVFIVLKEMLAGILQISSGPLGVADEGKYVFLKLSTLHLCTGSQTSVISRYTQIFIHLPAYEHNNDQKM
jgi:hypothetical protein